MVFCRKINLVTSPPKSPDLNPIENVLGTMKQAIRNEYKQRTLPQLEKAIKRYWGMKLTPEVCEWYHT